MSAPTRTALVSLGPVNGTCWTPSLSGIGAPTPLWTGFGDSVEGVLYVAPRVTLNTVGGPILDSPGNLASGGAIQNLSQVLALTNANVAASLAGFTISFFLRRAGAVVGGGAFAGWTDGNSPAFTAWETIAVPFLPANTALKPVDVNHPVSATRAILPLQPLDVITAVIATTDAGAKSLLAFLDGQ